MPADPIKDDDESITLPAKVRVLAGAVAVVLLTFCVILIWRGREGGAVIALVVTGGVAGLLALVGTLPSRLIIGGNEARWQRRFTQEQLLRIDAEAAVEVAAEALPNEALREAAAQVDLPSAGGLPAGASLLAQIAAWRDRTVAHLEEAARVLDAEIQYHVDVSRAILALTSPGTVRYRADAMVSRDGHQVLVDFMRVETREKVDDLRHTALMLELPMLIIVESGHLTRYTDAGADTPTTIMARNSLAALMTALSELLEGAEKA